MGPFFMIIFASARTPLLGFSACFYSSDITAWGGLHLGKPNQIWISPNRGPPDPDFLHIKKFQMSSLTDNSQKYMLVFRHLGVINSYPRWALVFHETIGNLTKSKSKLTYWLPYRLVVFYF